MLEPLTNQIMTVMLIVVLINALALDLHDRRIPNPLIGVGLLAGIAGHVWLSGLPGLGVPSGDRCTSSSRRPRRSCSVAFLRCSGCSDTTW